MDKRNFFTSKSFKLVLAIIIVFVISSTSAIVLIVNSDRIIRTPRQVLIEYLEGLRDKDIHKVAGAIHPIGSPQYETFLAQGDDYFLIASYEQFGEIAEFNIFNKVNQHSTTTANISYTVKDSYNNDNEFRMVVSFSKYNGQWYLTNDIATYTNYGPPSGPPGTDNPTPTPPPPPNTTPHTLTNAQKAEYNTGGNNSIYKQHTVPHGEHVTHETFRECKYLNEIVLPINITFIDPTWFYDCENLVAITFSGTSQTLASVDGVIYNKDKTVLIYFPRGKGEVAGSPQGEFHIPNGVATISQSAFSHYSGQIKKVVFPQTVKTIETDVFFRSFNTFDSQVILNEGLETIGARAFQETQIANIALPSTVTAIGAETFKKAQGLYSLTIPQNSQLKAIGYAAFEGATNLTSIYIPQGVTKIDNWTFDGCINLNEINLHNDIKSIGMFAFRECKSLSELYIPRNITDIGKGAFHTANQLTLSIEVSAKPAGWHSSWDYGMLKPPIWNVAPPK
ncbi:MAG: leucine-rich repeat domain-containing protein [Clostridia bacterium]